MDSKFESAGGLVAKGRYWFELPWPKRSLAKSAETLQKAIALAPDNLRAYVYLAETQLRDGKAAAAKATLAKAEQGSVTYDPAEGKRAKEMAKRVAAEIAKELK
jgi:cytochrome c-type biogenesis protein CcmH/NrfG